jgi:glucose 1-dehydrogenase
VLELANQGANIVIDYISHPEATEELEQKVIALGDQAIGVQADVSQISDLQRLIETAVAKFGRLDIMVNDAGIETLIACVSRVPTQFRQVLEAAKAHGAS